MTPKAPLDSSADIQSRTRSKKFLPEWIEENEHAFLALGLERFGWEARKVA